MPRQITTIASLKHYLYLAMQLEHATVPPYLTALYSIKPGCNFDAVQALRVVAVEEMLHLALTANLLNAIGGAPKLSDPDFIPDYPAPLPDGENDFQVSMQPFSRDAVETFLKIERPNMAPNPESRLLRRPNRLGASLLGACPNDPNLHYYSIGEFYREIEDGFIHLDDEARRKRETIFVGEISKQVTAEHYYSGGGRLFPITDLKTARQALNAIIGQGEGEDRGIYGPEGELAHYYRFKQLKCGRYYQTSDAARAQGNAPPDPSGPELKVDWTQVYPIKTNAKLADYDPGSEAHAAATDFNKAYARFLGVLERAFNGEPNLLTEAVPMMFEIRNHLNQLMRNPLKDGSEFNAAPTFEVGALVERRHE